MKKVLLILKEIRDYTKAEMMCVALAVELNEIGVNAMIFANNIEGNESTNRLGVKRVKTYDIAHKSVDNIPKEFDAIIALDEWATQNIPKQVSSVIKIKVSDTADVKKTVFTIIEKMKGEKAEEKEVEPKKTIPHKTMPKPARVVKHKHIAKKK